MAKWMVRDDSAHRVGLVFYTQSLADSSGDISKVVNIPAAGF